MPPGRYFRLLLIGYFEGLDAERAMAWRAADSFALRECLGLLGVNPSSHHPTTTVQNIVPNRPPCAPLV